MGAFTALEDADVRALARAFGVGEVTSWRSIAAGTINSNFAIVTDRDRYFLRINEGKAEEAVRYEAELVRELAAAGVPVAAPRATASGVPFVRHEGRLASLFSWIDGGHRAGGEVRERDAESVGAALAALHRAGIPLADRFERAGIYTFADIVRRFEVIRRTDDAVLGPAVAAIADEVAWLRAREPERAAAARGVIHGDLFPDNVVFRGDELAALIDFEQASTGSLVYDLAVCVNAWCFTDDFEPALVRALVGGYRSVRALEEGEERALYAEVRAAAMRFTVTRITDVYLPGTGNPDKDFRSYLRRLERWQAIGADELARWTAP